MNRHLFAAAATSMALAILTTGGLLFIARSGHHSHVPAVVTSPTASPDASASPSPSPNALLTCRLPVIARSGPSAQPELGWLDQDTGAYAAESTDLLVDDSSGPTSHSVEQPVLRGSGLTGATYDAQAKRWVPAGPPAISPDGTQYFYFDPASKTIHVVTVASGADHTFALPTAPDGGLYFPVGFNRTGIYLQEGSQAGYVNGLERLDPATGSVTEISKTTPQITLLEDGFAWSIWTPPYKPDAPPSTYRFDRIDLSSGGVTASYSMPVPVSDSGFTFQQPILWGSDGKGGLLALLNGTGPAPVPPRQLILVSPDGSIRTVYDGPLLNAVTGRNWADGHGIWLSTDGTWPQAGPSILYLIPPGGSLTKIADLGSQRSYDIAGPCVPRS